MLNGRICSLPRVAAVTLSAAVFGGYGTAASAAVISAQSEGYGAHIDLNIVNLINVDTLQLIPGQISSGSAPMPYNDTASAVNLNVDAGVGIGPILGTEVALDLATATGVLSSSAASNVDGLAGSRSVFANGQVDGLTLGIADATVSLPLVGTTASTLLELGATTIASTASISGDAGSLLATGTSTIEDLTLSIDNITINLADLLGVNGNIDANGVLTAAPNTTLLNVGGITNLRLVLNEQVMTGDGLTSRGIEVNAIHLYFDGVNLDLPLVSNLLTGEVVLGHSQAQISAVPEPASLALCLMGLGCFLRRPNGMKRV